ncbi:NHL repeat-containing protein [Pseudaminobacter sp. NGMCC 1.201702]|uniref:hypothetical protein n=1 Tax=Pseudaminobacter sp. NGMCC 1.201702 TaxID=3391825 RepID=UPI0039EE8DF5
MAQTAETVFRDFVIDGVASSGANKVKKAEVRELLRGYETAIAGFQAGGGVIFQTKAAMVLTYAANQMAWVVADATAANNGIYQKQGASGGGSWSRVADLPYSFVRANNAGAGTADAIAATSSIPLPSATYGAIILMNVAVANTGAVTISINGAAAKPLVTNSGNALAAGYLAAGMLVAFVDAGANYRLLSDIVSSSIVAAADAARVDAEAARLAAEAAAAGVNLPSVTANTMLVDNAAGTARETRTFDEVRSLLGVGLRLTRKTNRLPYGSFIRGAEGWAVSNPAAARVFFSFETDTSDNMARYFTRSKVQLDASAASQTLLAGSASIFAVESERACVVGFWGAAYGSVDPLPINIQVKCYDDGGSLLGTLTIAKSVAAARSPTGSFYLGLVNAQGGASPAWPAGTVSASVFVSLSSTAAQGLHCFAVLAIPSDEYPGQPTATALSNAGGGTHEALTIGDYLYVLNHGFNWLVKFDADLKYVGHISTGDYPHDIVAIGGDLWVANFDAATLQRVNIGTFSVTNTYNITGGRGGFGLATDGARLWLGAGTNAQGCALYEVDISTGVMTLLSTDLNTGGANIPVRYLDGSVWTIHEGNSQVKRINPTGGATIATINCGLGRLYGLGVGEGFVWANGRNGVAKIDPATNTVVAKYLYRSLTSGQSNVLVHKGFALACGEQGVMAVNAQTGAVQELLLDSGACKWVRDMPNGDIAVGAYAAPWMFVLRA